MADIEDLLGLEDGFYQEGYDAGVADSVHAGLVEGKTFGIEKGYDKALELGKLQGRALVWRSRALDRPLPSEKPASKCDSVPEELMKAWSAMAPLAKNARLAKNIDNLLSITDSDQIPKDNNDESVEQVEDALIKSKAKSKIIAATVGEPIDAGTVTARNIEDSLGLSARH